VDKQLFLNSLLWLSTLIGGQLFVWLTQHRLKDRFKSLNQQFANTDLVLGDAIMLFLSTLLFLGSSGGLFWIDPISVELSFLLRKKTSNALNHLFNGEKNSNP